MIKIGDHVKVRVSLYPDWYGWAPPDCITGKPAPANHDNETGVVVNIFAVKDKNYVNELRVSIKLDEPNPKDYFTDRYVCVHIKAVELDVPYIDENLTETDKHAANDILCL
jgi:hypothetical protein